MSARCHCLSKGSVPGPQVAAAGNAVLHQWSAMGDDPWADEGAQGEPCMTGSTEPVREAGHESHRVTILDKAAASSYCGENHRFLTHKQ